MQRSAGKQTQHGIRGIFIGFVTNQKGYLFYSPASWQIYISGDVTFDKIFSSTIATMWHLHHDNLALRPATSDIPLTTTTLETTGGVDDITSFSLAIKEGDLELEQKNEKNDDDDNIPDLMDSADDDSVSEAKYDSDMEHDLDDDVILDLE